MLTTTLFSVWAGSTVKPENDVLIAVDGREIERSNEDRYLLKEGEKGALIAAVADGAGGEGLFCGEWAGKLLEKLPDFPIATPEEVSNWLETFRTPFHEEFKQRAASDYFLQRKFEREGAYSTLSAAWLRPHDSGVRLEAFRYGDSPIFIWNYRTQPYLRLAWPNGFDSYTTNPYLLDSKHGLQQSKVNIISAIELVPDDVVIIATDGFGQYISLIAAYLTNNECHLSPASASMRATADLVLSLNDSSLTALVEAHKNSQMFVRKNALDAILHGFDAKSSFAEFVAAQYAESLLPNDDCTAIVIRVCRPEIMRAPGLSRHTCGST